MADFLTINYFIINCHIYLFQCHKCYQSLMSVSYRTNKLMVVNEINYQTVAALLLTALERKTQGLHEDEETPVQTDALL